MQNHPTASYVFSCRYQLNRRKEVYDFDLLTKAFAGPYTYVNAKDECAFILDFLKFKADISVKKLQKGDYCHGCFAGNQEPAQGESGD